MHVNSQPFTSDGSFRKLAARAAHYSHASPFQALCHSCGFTAHDPQAPPKRCPKCGAGAWDQLPIPGRLRVDGGSFTPATAYA
jgi:hypothetical protein